MRRTAAIVFVVAAFGVAIFLAVRTFGPSSAGGSGSRSGILMVCEQCGHETNFSGEQILDTPREGGAFKCPSCGAFRMLHATAPCQKCGKHLPQDPSLTKCPWCKAPLGPTAAPAPSGT